MPKIRRNINALLLVVFLFTSIVPRISCASSGAKLKFKSSFEPLVFITHSRNGQSSSLHGAEQDLTRPIMTTYIFSNHDWDSLHHNFNYLYEGMYPGVVNTFIDDRFNESRKGAPPTGAKEGSRALFAYVDHEVGLIRNALEIFCHDGQSSNPQTISNMQHIYWSKWLYIPPDFDIQSWHAMGSVREYQTYEYTYEGKTNYADFVCHPMIMKRNGRIFWHADARAYTKPKHTYYFYVDNKTAEVPLGRWFKMACYVYRHRYNGFFKMWIDGVKVFDIQTVETKWTTSAHSFRLKAYNVGEAGAELYHYPFYQWIDELEIWDGIPPYDNNNHYNNHYGQVKLDLVLNIIIVVSVIFAYSIWKRKASTR